MRAEAGARALHVPATGRARGAMSDKPPPAMGAELLAWQKEFGLRIGMDGVAHGVVFQGGTLSKASRALRVNAVSECYQACEGPFSVTNSDD